MDSSAIVFMSAHWIFLLELMLALACAALSAVPASLMKDAWLDPTYSSARCLWISPSSSAISSVARMAPSRQTCSDILTGQLCTRGCGAWSGMPGWRVLPTSLGTRSPKSQMVHSGIGSVSMTGGMSRLTSELVCTPSSSLHGSFLRVRVCMARRSSSLSWKPLASPVAGVHSGSTRRSGRHDVPMISAVRVAVSRVDRSMAPVWLARSLASSYSRLAACQTPSWHDSSAWMPMNERVIPPAALGSARQVSSRMYRS